MRGLNAHGNRIPDEISLIGYDDISFAPQAAIALSSISQPAFELGVKATELLISEFEAKTTHIHEKIKFQPLLKERASTGRVKELVWN
jgi:LacI family transcriptional regulator